MIEGMGRKSAASNQISDIHFKLQRRTVEVKETPGRRLYSVVDRGSDRAERKG